MSGERFDDSDLSGYKPRKLGPEDEPEMLICRGCDSAFDPLWGTPLNEVGLCEDCASGDESEDELNRDMDTRDRVRAVRDVLGTFWR